MLDLEFYHTMYINYVTQSEVITFPTRALGKLSAETQFFVISVILFYGIIRLASLNHHVPVFFFVALIYSMGIMIFNIWQDDFRSLKPNCRSMRSFGFWIAYFHRAADITYRVTLLSLLALVWSGGHVLVIVVCEAVAHIIFVKRHTRLHIRLLHTPISAKHKESRETIRRQVWCRFVLNIIIIASVCIGIFTNVHSWCDNSYLICGDFDYHKQLTSENSNTKIIIIILLACCVLMSYFGDKWTNYVINNIVDSSRETYEPSKNGTIGNPLADLIFNHDWDAIYEFSFVDTDLMHQLLSDAQFCTQLLLYIPTDHPLMSKILSQKSLLQSLYQQVLIKNNALHSNNDDHVTPRVQTQEEIETIFKITSKMKQIVDIDQFDEFIMSVGGDEWKNCFTVIAIVFQILTKGYGNNHFESNIVLQHWSKHRNLFVQRLDPRLLLKIVETLEKFDSPYNRKYFDIFYYIWNNVFRYQTDLADNQSTVLRMLQNFSDVVSMFSQHGSVHFEAIAASKNAVKIWDILDFIQIGINCNYNHDDVENNDDDHLGVESKIDPTVTLLALDHENNVEMGTIDIVNTLKLKNNIIQKNEASGTGGYDFSMFSKTVDTKILGLHNPLIMVLGIGKYKGNLPDLIGISSDYSNIKYTFNCLRGYSIVYMTNNNDIKHINTRSSKSQIVDNFKIEWTESEIDNYNSTVINTYLNNDDEVEYNYDGLFYFVSCHGDTDDIIYDSDCVEIPLSYIFYQFSNSKCKALRNKPKMFVLDCCRGGLRTKKVENSAFIKTDDKSKFVSLELESKHGYHQVTEPEKKDNDNDNDKMVKINIQENNHNLAQDKKKNNNNNKTDNFTNMSYYYQDGNFCFIWANTGGYAAVDGGIKGGYLIRSLTKIIANDYAFQSYNLNQIVMQTKTVLEKLLGNVAAQVVDYNNRMPYFIKLHSK